VLGGHLLLQSDPPNLQKRYPFKNCFRLQGFHINFFLIVLTGYAISKLVVFYSSSPPIFWSVLSFLFFPELFYPKYLCKAYFRRSHRIWDDLAFQKTISAFNTTFWCVVCFLFSTKGHLLTGILCSPNSAVRFNTFFYHP